MLLPQTEAFHLLRNRLQCVPNFWQNPLIHPEKEDEVFVELLEHFKNVQSLHRIHKLDQRKLSIQLWEKNK